MAEGDLHLSNQVLGDECGSNVVQIIKFSVLKVTWVKNHWPIGGALAIERKCT